MPWVLGGCNTAVPVLVEACSLSPGVQVFDKPLDAVTKANEMAESEPGKMCSLFIVHSKFFNITKDPFAATLFKTAQVSCVQA